MVPLGGFTIFPFPLEELAWYGPTGEARRGEGHNQQGVADAVQKIGVRKRDGCSKRQTVMGDEGV